MFQPLQFLATDYDRLQGKRFLNISTTEVSEKAWLKVPDTKVLEPVLSDECGAFRLATGCVVREKDGRYWLAEPANHFLGFTATFPGGGLEEGLTPQANARKETWEEMGLLVKITGWLGDITSDLGRRRYYIAERLGGNPGAMCWETQAVHLVDRANAWTMLNSVRDRNLLLWAEAGRRGQQMYIPGGNNIVVPLAPRAAVEDYAI